MRSARASLAKISLYTILAFAHLANAEEPAFGSLQVERLEHQAKHDLTLLDLEAWYGTDSHHWVAKLDAESDSFDDDVQLTLLYRRPWTAFFDVELGLELTEDYSAIAAGIEGEAPYRVETELTAIVTEDGDALLRAELQQDLLVTQRLSVQPRLELNAALQDVTEMGLAAGFNELLIELRLRYDVNRKFTPYIGLSWQRALGDTASIVEASGRDKNLTSAVAGLSFWF